MGQTLGLIGAMSLILAVSCYADDYIPDTAGTGVTSPTTPYVGSPGGYSQHSWENNTNFPGQLQTSGTQPNYPGLKDSIQYDLPKFRYPYLNQRYTPNLSEHGQGGGGIPIPPIKSFEQACYEYINQCISAHVCNDERIKKCVRLK